MSTCKRKTASFVDPEAPPSSLALLSSHSASCGVLLVPNAITIATIIISRLATAIVFATVDFRVGYRTSGINNISIMETNQLLLLLLLINVAVAVIIGTAAPFLVADVDANTTIVYYCAPFVHE